MSKDAIVEISAWIIISVILLLYIPKNKLRHAWLIFFFKQFMTWVIGLLIVQYGLIEYPVRIFFKDATKTSFTFEYFVYPALCVIFNLHYPNNKNLFSRFMHYFYYCTTMSLIEEIIRRYTNLIRYIHWSWYLTWLTLLITFFASRLFYNWFFKLKESTNKS